MKTMNSFRSAITSKIRVVIGSTLFGSAIISTNCFAKIVLPNVEVIAQGESQLAITVPVVPLLAYYRLPNKVAFIELKDNVLFAKQYGIIKYISSSSSMKQTLNQKRKVTKSNS